jgi:hypothetical protein
MGDLQPMRTPLFGKDITMTHHSSTTSETDEIEFTASYGTTVAIAGKRQSAIRSDQAAALRMPPYCERK